MRKNYYDPKPTTEVEILIDHEGDEWNGGFGEQDF